MIREVFLINCAPNVNLDMFIDLVTIHHAAQIQNRLRESVFAFGGGAK